MATAGGATVTFDVPVRMRDGAVLYADVYLPAADGPFPALLTRTPYDKSTAFSRTPGSGAVGMAAVRGGFAVVVQDTRGRHSSEGEFMPFVHEAQDGYDTVEWVAAQPWSNGKVGMFGGSYVGATQWLAATAQPPHLTAIAPAITASDYHEGWTYQGGAFELGFNLSWALGPLTMRNRENLRRRLGLDADRIEAMVDAVDGMQGAFKTLPLASQPALSRKEAAYYFEWLSHPADDDYWQRLRIENHHERLKVPSLNIGGWYDIFLGGTIRNYMRMRELGGSEAARSGARLVIGPWSHTALGGNAAGGVVFGQRAGPVGFDLDDMHIRWYERWLMDAENGVDDEPPVRIFVMGDNCWRDEREWPLSRAVRTRYYLHSAGRANTRNGDGALSIELPEGERPDAFLYDPMNPVPTAGGALCCAPWPGALPAGPMNHASKEDRADVLVYSTPPLERDVEVTGPVTVTLWASSSAVDTDFTAMLLDVAPCGQSMNLCDGVVRARYRRSRSKAELLRPGIAEKFEIDLVSTSNVFKKGHRIRLEISSSNSPRFDRNLNTGKGFDDAEAVVAMNTVFHDAERPSYLELDVVER